MPFCPVCRTEYREGFTECSECGQKLVESLEPQPADEKKPQTYIDDKPALLISGKSDIDSGMIEGCLKSADIPFYKKDHETGGYMRVYMGYSVYGADFYVPSMLLERAKEVLDASLPPDFFSTDDESSVDSGDAGKTDDNAMPEEAPKDRLLTRKLVARIVLAFMLLGLFVSFFLLPILKFFGIG